MCHVHLIRAVLKTIPNKESIENPLQLSKITEYLEEKRFYKAI
jgi:hypothetical protein